VSAPRSSKLVCKNQTISFLALCELFEDTFISHFLYFIHIVHEYHAHLNVCIVTDDIEFLNFLKSLPAVRFHPTRITFSPSSPRNGQKSYIQVSLPNHLTSKYYVGPRRGNNRSKSFVSSREKFVTVSRANFNTPWKAKLTFFNP
jgi:hypothetical protein